MENKKLIKILLKDISDLDELVSENENGKFDAFEMELLSSRIKNAKKLMQMILESEMQTIVIEKNEIIKPIEQPSQISIINTPEKENTAHSIVSEKPDDNSLTPADDAQVDFMEEIQEVVPAQAEVSVFRVEPDAKIETSSPAIEEQVQMEPVKSPDSIENQQIQKTRIKETKKIEPQQRLGDKFKKEKSVNDQLTDSHKLEFKLSNMPVSSIQNAIGINDRFLYIRELFDGDAGKFTETVSKLDMMNEINQAVEYLQQNFKWKKNETSLKFVNLVKRRFPNEQLG